MRERAQSVRMLFLSVALVVAATAATRTAVAQSENEIDQYNQGQRYLNGKGVPQDYAEALRWFRKAADRGYPLAQVSLGVMYLHGNGVRQDYAEALRWFRKAADLVGYSTAQSFLGLMYEKGLGVRQNIDEAVRQYRKAAEKGDTAAQGILGNMYLHERHGLSPRSPITNVEAHKWLNLAGSRLSSASKARAERDIIAEEYMTPAQIAEAQRLAREWKPFVDYDHRIRVDYDDEDKTMEYRKAADTGDVGAQYILGTRYESRRGVPQDYVEAHKWYNLAGSRSSSLDKIPDKGVKYDDLADGMTPRLIAEGSVRYRDKLAKKMTPSQIAEAQRLAREWKPAEKAP